MRIKLMTACTVVSLTLLSAVADAQSAPTTAPTQTTTATASAEPLTKADVVTVPVWPKMAVTLPESQQPVATSFALGQIEGIKPELISGVTANGYARQVAVENQKIGQVLVMSVAKDGKEEAIASEGLTAQFDATETSQLFPEKNITVEGSKAALVAALEKLAAADKKDDEKKEVKDTTQENAVGSNASGNDLASSYKTPSATAATATEDEPTITVSSTTDGCPVRVDLSQEKAFVQSKEQTFSDGALSAETECSDSEVSYPLKKSYLACPDVVDLSAMTALAQYTIYYTDGSAENHTVSECTKDDETPYTIAEDEGQCSVFLDFNAGQAVPQSALVYTNRSGAIVQARGCDTSTKTAALPMTESTTACPLRHDYAAGKSYELSMWTYVRDGVTYQAAPCADTGRVFTQETIYTDSAGEYVCSPIVNQSAGTVTLQSRKRITIDGVNQYVTDCTPDTATQAILSTTDGCMDASKWTHDIEAGVSYGQERFYYLKGGSTPVYVTACQTSSVTYTQDQQITGYQYHDDQLYAFPLSTVTISIGGSTYTIKNSEVLAGATQFAYTLAGTVDQQNGQATYEGCNAYYSTTKSEKWERPDGSFYFKPIGEGSPVGPSDICSTTTENAQYYAVSYHNGGGANGAGSVSSTLYYLARTVKTNPVTNEVFTGSKTTTGQTNWSVTGTSGSGCVVQPPSGSSPFATVSLGCQDEGSGYYYVTVIKGPCASSTIYGTFNQTDGKSGSFTCGWTNNSYTWP
jgi:hypothetical protein